MTEKEESCGEELILFSTLSILQLIKDAQVGAGSNVQTTIDEEANSQTVPCMHRLIVISSFEAVSLALSVEVLKDGRKDLFPKMDLSNRDLDRCEISTWAQENLALTLIDCGLTLRCSFLTQSSQQTIATSSKDLLLLGNLQWTVMPSLIVDSTSMAQEGILFLRLSTVCVTATTSATGPTAPGVSVASASPSSSPTPTSPSPSIPPSSPIAKSPRSYSPTLATSSFRSSRYASRE